MSLKYRIRPLITLLEDVKRFVEETKEIVFLDFHGFPIGFTSRLIHDELFQFLWKVIGKHMVPKTVPASQLTPNMLWRTNKTIIVTYAEGSISSLNEHLWPYLVHVSTLFIRRLLIWHNFAIWHNERNNMLNWPCFKRRRGEISGNKWTWKNIWEKRLSISNIPIIFGRRWLKSLQNL